MRTLIGKPIKVGAITSTRFLEREREDLTKNQQSSAGINEIVRGFNFAESVKDVKQTS